MLHVSRCTFVVLMIKGEVKRGKGVREGAKAEGQRDGRNEGKRVLGKVL